MVGSYETVLIPRLVYTYTLELLVGEVGLMLPDVFSHLHS